MRMILVILIIAALMACIRYDIGSGRLIRYSKRVKAWIPIEDFEKGKDSDPKYVPPPGLVPDWTREVISLFPADKASIARLDAAGELEMVEAQWGLVPHWAKEASFGKKFSYNCRNDSLSASRADTKPTWREPFHQGRRCIVPAAAFFERDMSIKHWIRMSAADEHPLSIAGLWEPANALVKVPTFTMVTTEPNIRVGEFHDRMPVMLDADAVEEWLDPKSKPADLLRLLIPSPEDYLALEDAGPIGGKKKDRDNEPTLF